MKKTLILFLILVSSTYSQTYHLNVWSKGKVTSIPISEIKKLTFTNISSIKENGKAASLISTFALFQNYPNPFNPSTTIRYEIPVVDAPSSAEVHVTLKVYDVLGREVATLVDEFKQPGIYNSKLRIDNGELSSGIYYYRLAAGNFSSVKKMLLVK